MKFHLLFVTLVTALLLVACGSSAQPTSDNVIPTEVAAFTPVTIEVCATTSGSDSDISVSTLSFTYDEPPKRAVTLNQHATEIMLALGLEERMVGTAYIDDEILKEYQEVYNKVAVLADEYPSREVLLSVEPDFVYGGFSSAFRDTAAGPQEQLKSLGIGSYLTSAICRESADSLDDVYTDIRNIAKIFGVVDRGEALVSGLESEIAQIKSALKSADRPLRMFLYDSGDAAPYTSVCCSMFTALAESVGGKNIFDDVGGRWSTVNWEEVIARDPEVIVLTDAVWSSSQEKKDLLLNTAAYADITAVKNQRFVVLNFTSLVPGIRNPGAIRQLAESIYPDRFN